MPGPRVTLLDNYESCKRGRIWQSIGVAIHSLDVSTDVMLTKLTILTENNFLPDPNWVGIMSGKSLPA